MILQVRQGNWAAQLFAGASEGSDQENAELAEEQRQDARTAMPAQASLASAGGSQRRRE
jgi:hypothetical protein